MAATHFKMVLLGNAGVGKSCLVLRFVREEFFEDQETTIGAAFLTKSLSLEEGPAKLEIWDTAGQERYRSLAPMYYRGSAAAIVVYSIIDRDSFAGAQSWVKELQKKGDANIVILLAGNKADLASKRKVDTEEAREYARTNGLLFVETSARDNVEVEHAFRMLAKAVLPKVKGAAPSDAKRDVVSLQANKPPETAKGSMCCG